VALVPERHEVSTASAQRPSARPLLYTALRQAPLFLAWPDAPEASAYDLYVNDRRAGTARHRAWFAWPRNRPLRAGELADWMIVPCDGPKVSLAGQFWVLDHAQRTRLEEAESIATRIDDSDLRDIALGLIAAEFGLYDEAVTLLDDVAERLPPRGRGALAQRALLAVFAEMQDSLRPEANDTARAWIQARRDWHEKRLLERLPDTGAAA